MLLQTPVKNKVCPIDDYYIGILGHWIFLSKDTVINCTDIPLKNNLESKQYN